MQPKKLIYLILLIGILLSAPAYGGERVVQSKLVEFPVSGKVLIQAREQFNQNPRILMTSRATGKVLLSRSISEDDDLLKPQTDDPSSVLNPYLRFRVLQSKGFSSPMVLAVAVSTGGSDHGFFGIIIGEVDGKLQVLTGENLVTNVQSGLFLGYLNKRWGYGLVRWKFTWDDGAHYDFHPYEIEIYKLKGGKFQSVHKYISKRKYFGRGFRALRELGIKAVDQRKGIPRMRDYLE
jgi:hypothetical protein